MKEGLKKLFSLFDRKEKMQLLRLMGLMIVGSFMDAAGVGAVPAFVAALAIPDKVMAVPILADITHFLGITTGRQLVIWGAFGLIVVFLLKNVFLSFITWVQVRTTESYRIKFSRRLFSAYMNAPYEIHLKRNTAELLRNVTMEVGVVVESVIMQVMSTVMATLMSLLIVTLLLVATPLIAFITVLLIGFGSWMFLRVTKNRLRRYGRRAQLEKRKSIQAVNQGLGGLSEARVLGRENFFINIYDKSNRAFTRARRMFRFTNNVGTRVLESVAITGLLVVVLALVFVGTDLQTLIPILALFGAAVVRLRATINSIVTGITNLRYNLVSVDPVWEDLNALEKYMLPDRLVPELGGVREKLPLKSELSFSGVSYTYPDTSAPVLQDISLAIEQGSSVGFVGATGSGKTTLINLILGLLEPGEGTISADGVPITEHMEAWRANIGHIPQTIYLLDDTIRRNIAFGVPENEINEERLSSAIRDAQLTEFISTLEDGIDSVVGERGLRISGGQRQRIGLARALYHDPEVLIMDEATSALDNQTENMVMQAIDDLRGRRTIIMIAHRLSTVQKCDQLFFLKDGRVSAQGTYDELQRESEEFRVMAEA